MANAEISVAVERVIHDVLREVVQNISDQHGVRVNDVSFDWSITIGDGSTVLKVRVNSET